MTIKSEVLDPETGEVLDQSAMIVADEGMSVKELIPYNRLSNIAKSVPVRIIWNKRAGYWETPLGDFSEINIVPIAASELYAVWTDQVGKPEYYGTTPPEGIRENLIETGYRLAFQEETIGPCYTDLFGIAKDFGEAVCKIGYNNKGVTITVKGSTTINTGGGTFHKPKIIR